MEPPGGDVGHSLGLLHGAAGGGGEEGARDSGYSSGTDLAEDREALRMSEFSSERGSTANGLAALEGLKIVDEGGAARAEGAVGASCAASCSASGSRCTDLAEERVPIRLERGLEEFRSPCQSSPMDSGGVNLHKQELNAEL